MLRASSKLEQGAGEYIDGASGRGTGQNDRRREELVLKEVRTRTASARWIGGFLVFVHGAEPPADSEWEELLSLFRMATEEGQTSLRVLVYSEGGAPNARQRAQLNEVLAGIKPRVAVLTPSATARAVGVAISWFNPDLRVFSGDELGRGLDHLDVNHGERRILTHALTELRAQKKSSYPPG